jgi:osmotically-inducible protein OsmY
MKKLNVLILLALFALLLPAGCRSLNQVTPAALDDAAIEAEVRARMTSDLALGAFQISVGVENGVVTLNGEVDTDEQRRSAAQTASRVDGVRSVINNLRLRT